MDNVPLISRLFDVIEFDIAPLTRRGVADGNKIFGAAILRKSDLSLIVAETNNETENPLWHGEVHAIKRYYERLGGAPPEAKGCLFLATHEPCSLCLSAITWSGFDNFYYLFDYEDTQDSFEIPHDIRILREVYAVPDPDRDKVMPGRDLYNRENTFFTSHSLVKMIGDLEVGAKSRLLSRAARLTTIYRDLSSAYQAGKGAKGIPLS